ncbi:uncharacterized protein LOC126901680 [Daktulosphaira vitifoliae]|uniref:uncharacterized protein LOC126901680 n=1 Tax=Daktulosphaira vitifoliae TaxID=58002 RepID=UPI0021A98731|nr:uncharacterized protein LOC126901680 [Daktulosphaira vitifoliae]
MQSIINIKIYILIFTMISYFEVLCIKKHNIHLLEYLLSHDGWKNLDDVKYVKYRKNNFTLEDVIKQPILNSEYNRRIHITKIFLGCSYVNVLVTILFTLDNFLNHCRFIGIQENPHEYVYYCTNELIYIIRRIIWMTNLMQGALDSIEKYHGSLWGTNLCNNYILNTVITNLRNYVPLKKILIPKINPIITQQTLSAIKEFFFKRNRELKKDLSKCNLKSTDLTVLWKSWNEEFDETLSVGKKPKFYDFLSTKINYIAQQTIQEKYLNLGFIYNEETQETTVPTLPVNFEHSQHVDIITNESDSKLPEENNEKEISKNPKSDASIVSQHIDFTINKSDVEVNPEVEDGSPQLLIIPDHLKQINMYL